MINANYSLRRRALIPRASRLFLFSALCLCVGVSISTPSKAQTVIGGLTPDPSAMLDVQSQSKGVLFPRMTTAERNLITNAPTGLMIFNTSENRLQINLGTPGNASWQNINPKGSIFNLNCASAGLTGSLSSGQAASGVSVSVAYTDGDGQSYGGQTVNSTGVTGLTATLSAGSFATGAGNLSYAITGTPNVDGLAAFTLNIGGQSCTLNVPVGCGAYIGAWQWKVFSCYNLGAANTSADPFMPSWEINGDYWRWGTKIKAADGPTGPGGNPEANSGAVTGWNDLPVGGNGAWVDTNPMTSNPMDNPCSAGFRVPSRTQWEGVINNNSITDAVGSSWSSSPTNYTSGKNFGSALFLPAAGLRDDFTGTLFGRGIYGDYWSSTELESGGALGLGFDSGGAKVTSSDRALGLSVRCIAE